MALNVVKARRRLPTLCSTAAGGVYAQNMSLPVVTAQPADKAAGSCWRMPRSGGYAPSSGTSAGCPRPRAGSRCPVCGDAAAVALAVNNLSPMKLTAAVDFAPAVVASSSSSSSSRGHPAPWSSCPLQKRGAGDAKSDRLTMRRSGVCLAWNHTTSLHSFISITRLKFVFSVQRQIRAERGQPAGGGSPAPPT
ncbi:hypothetical protein AAL_00766 [Moelleriella libera RCEF 2490]|uniref:Uncharacterized protein n=1 Tax=Moelleriella libera RCEF 2490 TaxID=1081109 RepID=A0A166V5W4_9HYPO|nr:hypothetical protein AAL_00766 [Moelleriella libera RCEF 2490]